MNGMIRPRKDGGYSECHSPDELVGKGRCCHILGNEEQPAMKITNIQRGMYEVDVGEGMPHVTIQAQKESMIKFFQSMPKMDDEKIKSIISFIEQEG